MKKLFRKNVRDYIRSSNFGSKALYYVGATSIKFKPDFYRGEHCYKRIIKLRWWHPALYIVLLIVAFMYFLDGIHSFFTQLVREFFDGYESSEIIK